MTLFCRHPFVRLAMLAALFGALGLAACGRKGPLDPPPGASLAQDPQPSAPAGLRLPIGGTAPAPVDTQATVIGPNGLPLPATGPKKHIPLDVLLD